MLLLFFKQKPAYEMRISDEFRRVLFRSKGLTFDSRLPNGPVSAREASDLLTGVTGTRLLIILDEYDRVEDSGFRRQTAELIKNLSARMAAVHVLIAGVAEALDGLTAYIPSIRRHLAPIEVPSLYRCPAVWEKGGA